MPFSIIHRGFQGFYRFVVDDGSVCGIVVVDPDAGVDAPFEHQGSDGRGGEPDPADLVVGTHEQSGMVHFK